MSVAGLACIVGVIVLVLKKTLLAKPANEAVAAQHPNDEGLNAAHPTLGASSRTPDQARTGLPDLQIEGKSIQRSQNMSPGMCDENGTYWDSGRYELP